MGVGAIFFWWLCQFSQPAFAQDGGAIVVHAKIIKTEKTWNPETHVGSLTFAIKLTDFQYKYDLRGYNFSSAESFQILSPQLAESCNVELQGRIEPSNTGDNPGVMILSMKNCDSQFFEISQKGFTAIFSGVQNAVDPIYFQDFVKLYVSF